MAEYLRVKWETVGNILTRVEKEKRKLWNPYDNLKRIGIDETSYNKGHKYLTVIVNHDTNTAVWVTKGYGKSTNKKSSPMRENFRKDLSVDGKEKWVQESAPLQRGSFTRCDVINGQPMR